MDLRQQAFPQPIVAIATTMLATLTLAGAYIVPMGRQGSGPTLDSAPLFLTSSGLLISLVLAHKFPIHLRFHLKVCMTSVPIYLMAVLLPPPLAATMVVAGMLTGELMMQAEKKNYASDIATLVARWAPLALLASLVAHFPGLGTSGSAASLGGAAVILLVGDFMTLPLALGPMLGEPPWPLVVPLVRDGVLAEGGQYLLGVLGALAAEQNPWAVILLVLPTALVYYACKSVKEMHTSTRRLLENMADAVDLRDPYTGGHSRRVTEYTEGILSALNLNGAEVELIVTAARVHDIGKIGIPDGVLNKPGKLDGEERALMETHAERGAELLRRHNDFARGMEIVRHHHEAWDGSGYPHRLAGSAIPFGSRVIAVADSYDAMTSDRPYRAGMSPQKAAAILREGRGTQWEPVIVDALLRALADTLQASQGAPHLHLVPSKAAAVATSA